MKKLLLVIISLTLLASVAWGQHHGGTISGNVQGQQEGGPVPLRYASVQAFQANNNWPTGMAMTDSLGNYTIYIPFGHYVVRAQARDFESLWYNNVVAQDAISINIINGLLHVHGL